MNIVKKLYIGAFMLASSLALKAQEVGADLEVPQAAKDAMKDLQDGAKNWVTEGVTFMGGLAVIGLAIYFLPRIIGWFKKMLGRLG